MSDLQKEYEASLKSIETENILDRMFYRPIGFRLARMLRGTGITPNMITIFSIFVGFGAGLMFYHPGLNYAIYGILFLVCANILDCVDGQLARLTHIKSEIGRILDGFAGDIWFGCIYVCFALRLGNEFGHTMLFVLIAIASGLSHLIQANVTDYYKTLHLYFISKDKGAELEILDDVKARKGKMKGINLFFFKLYVFYTAVQQNVTPRSHEMLKQMRVRYQDEIPESIRLSFRKASRKLMPLIDMMTFNGRVWFMFVAVLLGQVWLYYIYEIVILNSILAIAMHKHEKICISYTK